MCLCRRTKGRGTGRSGRRARGGERAAESAEGGSGGRREGGREEEGREGGREGGRGELAPRSLSPSLARSLPLPLRSAPTDRRRGRGRGRGFRGRGGAERRRRSSLSLDGRCPLPETSRRANRLLPSGWRGWARGVPRREVSIVPALRRLRAAGGAATFLRGSGQESPQRPRGGHGSWRPAQGVRRRVLKERTLPPAPGGSEAGRGGQRFPPGGSSQRCRRPAGAGRGGRGAARGALSRRVLGACWSLLGPVMHRCLAFG